MWAIEHLAESKSKSLANLEHSIRGTSQEPLSRDHLGGPVQKNPGARGDTPGRA